MRPPGSHFGPPGAPGALPGRSREPLGSLLGPPKTSKIAPGGSPGGPPHWSSIFEAFWGSFWLHFWTPRTSKNKVFVWRVLQFSKNRGVAKKHLKTTKNRNLSIMEREAREARERRSMASKARAARAAKTARGRAAGSPRGAKARVARAAPDSRQQARTIAYSLARALRALAGGLSWERLGRIALLRNASEILHKSLPEASRDLPGPPGAHFRPPGGHLRPLLAHVGPPGAHFGALPGRSREPLGSFLGLQKPPKSLPEALPEAPRTRA